MFLAAFSHVELWRCLFSFLFYLLRPMMNDETGDLISD
jgi:hypothetical protein